MDTLHLLLLSCCCSALATLYIEREVCAVRRCDRPVGTAAAICAYIKFIQESAGTGEADTHPLLALAVSSERYIE
jgi:hypothetical protein